jgi:hypothetical protein
MTTYQSDIKTISSSEEVVFGMLSDLNNLGKLGDIDKLQGKFRVVEYNTDSCLLELSQFGKVGFRIVDKTPYKSIRFETSYLPVEVNAEIKLDELSTNQTQMQLLLHANLPSVLKMMLNKQLEQGINVLADLFEKLLNNKLT